MPWTAGFGIVSNAGARFVEFDIQSDRIPEGDRALWPGEWRWVAYVVNDPDSARSLRRRGIDMIETDRFLPMAEALRDSQRSNRQARN